MVVNTEAWEKNWLNYQVGFPVFQENLQRIESNSEKLSVRDLIYMIQRMDRRAVALFYSRNDKSIIWDSKLSILQPKVQELIYSKEWWLKDDSELLIETLKEIAKIMVQEVESFLEDWDQEHSWENIALQLSLIDHTEEEIKERAEKKVFQPIKIEQKDKATRKIAKNLSKEQASSLIIKKISEIDVFKLDSDAIAEKIKSSISFIVWIPVWVYKTIKKIDSLEVHDGWLIIPIPIIRAALLWILLSQWAYKWKDYLDGHFQSIENIQQAESERMWEWEWERKYNIIQEEIFPILARWIRELNTKGSGPDYNDLWNNVFYMSSKYSGIVQENWCLTIDEAWWGETNHPIWTPDESWKIDCVISWTELTQMWIWNSQDYLLTIINHPESVRAIQRLAESNQ